MIIFCVIKIIVNGPDLLEIYKCNTGTVFGNTMSCKKISGGSTCIV